MRGRVESSGQWNEALDKALDGFDEATEPQQEEAFDKLSKWLEQAFGPEAFPPLTSSCTVLWQPPAPPIVTQIRAVGSGSVVGAPGAILGVGTSVILSVPIHRGQGGDYELTLAFDVIAVDTGGTVGWVR